MSTDQTKTSEDDLQERSRLLAEGGTELLEQKDIKDLFPEIIFQSKIMEKVLKTVLKISQTQSSTLILGESGTGKELIALAIHRLSARSHKCFVAINCSAIPENLLEAELFGHEKGAFTGADRKRIGLLAAAEQGTIFLDEIGDMPLRLQAKLLRVLQEKEFTPIGSNVSRRIDVRVIAATNTNLEEALRAQTFRLDLFYRLNVLQITLPPLKERFEDIPLLADHFVNQLNRVHLHTNPCWLDYELKEVLAKAPWPGNVRQLQNTIERMIVISSGSRLGIKDLPDELSTAVMANVAQRQKEISSVRLEGEIAYQLPESGVDLANYMEKIENQFILQALERTRNNKNQAAKLLGLNRTTLVERIKKRRIGGIKKEE